MKLNHSIYLAAFLLLPDPTLTPGSVRDGDLAVICSADYVHTHRSWRNRRSTYLKYNIPWNTRFKYADDDLIPVELGGDNRNKYNHWPQPLSLSYKKNRLENYYRRAACSSYRASGVHDAAPYQSMFKNWPASYKQVYGVDP